MELAHVKTVAELAEWASQAAAGSSDSGENRDFRLIAEGARNRVVANGGTVPVAPVVRIAEASREMLTEIEGVREFLRAQNERLSTLEKWLSLPWWKRLFVGP